MKTFIDDRPYFYRAQTFYVSSFIKENEDRAVFRIPQKVQE